MFELGHLQMAMLGLAMIAPRLSANANVPPPIEPDDDPPKSALEVPREPLKLPANVIVFKNDPIYSGKYLEPHQFAHRFCLWMVENGHTNWMLHWHVDNKIERFCKEKNYRFPDNTTIRSILADMLRDNYKERQYVSSAKYRHLSPFTTSERVTVYRFTPGLVAFLTKDYRAMDQIADRLLPSSHVAPVTPRSKARRSGRKNVSRNKKSRKNKAGATRLAAKNQTNRAHYLDDAGWGVAA